MKRKNSLLRFCNLKMMIFASQFCAQVLAQNASAEPTNLEKAMASKIPPEKMGSAVFEKTTLELGNIYRGQRFRVSFPFKNEGQGVLKIVNVTSACGCVQTPSESASQTIAPGSKGSVQIDFDSSLFVGKIQRTIVVETNSIFKPVTTLSLTAIVNQEIEPSINVINFGSVFSDVPSQASLILRIPQKAPLKLSDNSAGGESKFSVFFKPLEQVFSGFTELSSNERQDILKEKDEIEFVVVKPSSPLLKAEIVPKAEAEAESENKNSAAQNPQNSSGGSKTYELLVSLTGKLPVGPFRENIVLWNNSKYQKQLSIPVLGEVASHVRTSQMYVEFGVVAEGTQSRRSVTLASDNSDFEVKSVEINLKRNEGFANGLKESEFIEHKLLQTGKNVVVHFELKAPKGTLAVQKQNANASGFFLIRTNDPDLKEIKIPFFGIVRSSLSSQFKR